MKKQNNFFIIVITLFLFNISCNSQNIDKIINNSSFKDYSITIIDHRINPVFNKIVITDTIKIKKVLYQIKQTKKYIDNSPSIKQPPVKNNFGFLEIFITNAQDKRESFSVVYTVYDGVIIFIRDDYYKNDELEILLEQYIDEWVSSNT
ncbi:MAG: hypothetical protein EKK37_16440 [Sphingobacteriales bacterium]|nr:MAG: hypothetical protein EKK37_16440 [Sphingobacteriales bacterium]